MSSNHCSLQLSFIAKKDKQRQSKLCFELKCFSNGMNCPTSFSLDTKPSVETEKKVQERVLKQISLVGEMTSNCKTGRKLYSATKTDLHLLNEAYERCGQVTAKFNQEVYWGSLVMPPECRRAIWAFTAWYRRLDDIVDGPVGTSINPWALDEWMKRLVDLYEGRPYDIFDIALSDTLLKYNIDMQICLDVIEGLRLDLEKSRYENFDELYHYCCIAGLAGPMMVAVLGVAPESKISKENVYNATVKLGIATQLTNLLRDVGEDARMGRIYIPQDELARAGLSDEDIFRGKVTDKWRSFMGAQIQRARAYFDGAENGLDGVHSAGRWGFWASLLIYKQTLDAIEANDYDNFRKRASVGIAKKLITLPMAYAKANNPSFN